MKSDLSNTEIAPVTTLPESVRIPLHSLQADLEYLIGRVIADGSCGPMITKSMRDRLGQIEAAFIPANKAVAFCDWLYGYMGHGTAVTIGDYEATYIRSKLASLIKDIDGHRDGVPCANANGTDVYHETIRRVSAVREKRLADAPVWYGAEQADAWACGYNSALEEIGPAPQAVLDSIPPHLNYLIARGKTRPDELLYGVQILDGLKVVVQTENDDLIAAIREAVSSLTRPAPQPSSCLNCGDPSQEPFCGTCREMGCGGEKPSLSVKNDHALKSAAEKALNYIENTESELGIKLSCGDALREALK